MPVTEIAEGICFLISIAFLAAAAVYTVRLIRNRRNRTKRLIVVIGLLFASVFAMRLAAGIYMMTGGYAAAEEYSELNVAEVIFDSIVHGLQSFSMDEDYTLYLTAVRQMCGELFGTGVLQRVAGFLVSLQNVLAPLAGGAILLDILSNIFQSLRLVIKKGTGRHNFFVFSELNESAVCLAEDILKGDNAKTILHANRQSGSPVLIFTDAYVDSEEETPSELRDRVRALGGVCTKTDILFLNLKRAKSVYYFLIDEDRMKNLSMLAAMAEQPLHWRNREGKDSAGKAAAYIYVFTEGEKAGAYIRDLRRKHQDKFDGAVIREVNDHRSIAMNLLYDFPLYAPLVGHKVSEKRLTVTIFGSGQIAEEIFRNAYWYGQIYDYRLEINVLSENAQTLKQKLMRDYSEMMRTCEVDGQGPDWKVLRVFPPESGKDVFNPPYAYIRFVDYDVENGDLYTDQADILTRTHYFIAVFDDDRKNMGFAAELDQWLTRRFLGTARGFTPLIACAVCEGRLGRIVNREPRGNGGCWVVPFGSYRSRFSCRNIFLTDYTERAISVDKIYDKGHADADAEDEYKTLSSVARVAHASYKYFGEDRVESVSLAEMGMRIRIRGGRTDTGWLSDPKTKERLAWLEHRRWAAYIRAQGYAAPTSKEQLDFIYDHGKNAMNPKDVGLKIHPCLVETSIGIRPQGVSLNEMTYRECDLLDGLSRYLWLENRYDHGEKKREELQADDYDYKKWDYPECDVALMTPEFADA